MDASVSLENITFADRDEFNRKTIAENIIKLLDADVDFCPMVIDGGWGTGKTEFCRKLINLIKEQDAQRQASAQEVTARADRTAAGAAGGAMPGDAASQPAADESRPADVQAAALPPERAIIYLDAFASETVDDPLLCILAAIRAEFPEEKKKEISRKALPVVKTLGKVAGKAAFAHLFKQDLEEVSEELAEAASEGADALVEQTVDKLLDQYANAQKNLETLQEVLTIAAATRPIIFFIDELDRCRPDFALSILELVKHVFEVPGIKFVFVANMEQLKAVIRKRYGQDVDADVYLEKFVNLSIVLPSVDNETLNNASCMLLSKELCNFNLFEKNLNIMTYRYHFVITNKFEKVILHLIEKHDIKLRGVEKLIKNIKIYTTLTGKNPLSWSVSVAETLTFLLAMFVFTFKKNFIHKIIIEKIDEEFANVIGHIDDKDIEDVLIILHKKICNRLYNFNENQMHIIENDDSDRLFSCMCEGRYIDIRAYFIDYIRTMNMIFING